MLRGRHEANIVQDIARLLVPSAETFAVRGAKHLKNVENSNQGWNNSIPITKVPPHPDSSAGFQREAKKARAHYRRLVCWRVLTLRGHVLYVVSVPHVRGQVRDVWQDLEIHVQVQRRTRVVYGGIIEDGPSSPNLEPLGTSLHHTVFCHEPGWMFTLSAHRPTTGVPRPTWVATRQLQAKNKVHSAVMASLGKHRPVWVKHTTWARYFHLLGGPSLLRARMLNMMFKWSSPSQISPHCAHCLL